MRHGITATLSAAALGLATPAQAEIIKTSDDGFITRDEAVVDATLTQTWLALINPAEWWSSQHTWSADAANLRLTPQAGGCFCEKIPEVNEPDRFTLEGSVEHMRVIQAYPNSALRMIGALGPLQSEPVTGVLTIALTEVDLPDASGRKGTRVVWEYNVGGSMRYEVPVISKAVDGVMSLQLAGLAEKLGKVDMPDSADAETTETAEPDAAPMEDEAPIQADSASEDAPAVIKPESVLTGGKADIGKPAKKSPSVEEAFDDLIYPDAMPARGPEKEPEKGPDDGAVESGER